MNWLQKIANMTAQDMPSFLQSRGDFAYLKYVRVNGEYRFAEVAAFGADHTKLANGEPVESAGFIKVKPAGFWIEGYSSILKVGPAEDDEQNLSQLLSLPIRNKWDE